MEDFKNAYYRLMERGKLHTHRHQPSIRHLFAKSSDVDYRDIEFEGVYAKMICRDELSQVDGFGILRGDNRIFESKDKDKTYRYTDITPFDALSHMCYTLSPNLHTSNRIYTKHLSSDSRNRIRYSHEHCLSSSSDSSFTQHYNNLSSLSARDSNIRSLFMDVDMIYMMRYYVINSLDIEIEQDWKSCNSDRFNSLATEHGFGSSKVFDILSNLVKKSFKYPLYDTSEQQLPDSHYTFAEDLQSITDSLFENDKVYLEVRDVNSALNKSLIDILHALLFQRIIKPRTDSVGVYFMSRSLPKEGYLSNEFANMVRDLFLSMFVDLKYPMEARMNTSYCDWDIPAEFSEAEIGLLSIARVEKDAKLVYEILHPNSYYGDTFMAEMDRIILGVNDRYTAEDSFSSSPTRYARESGNHRYIVVHTMDYLTKYIPIEVPESHTVRSSRESLSRDLLMYLDIRRIESRTMSYKLI